MTRYWPLGVGRTITSRYGPRDDGFHAGVDFGRPGGSAGMPVYAVAGGTVLYAGAAQGYGGPDPAGWLVIDHPVADGGGTTEYGHIVRSVAVGQRVEAGQRIGTINPNQATNGGVAPHLHLSVMPAGYSPSAKIDPLPWLAGAREPEATTPGGSAVGWTGDPVWLEEVLRPALGSRLKVLAGWKQRGHGDFKDVRGVMIHHTGNSRETAQSIANGRPDLGGPLANLHIAPDGTVTIVAVGVCWHAGAGSYPWLPTNMGNWHLIGIECAWPDIRADGSFSEAQRWPDAQIISMRDTAAALSIKLGVGANCVIGHKEYAGRVQGKWDPGNLDMNWFRAEVAKDMAGGVFPGEAPGGGPAPSKPPVVVPPTNKPPVGAYADVLIYRPQAGSAVRDLQTRLKRNYSKLVVDGIFGEHTEKCVLDFQRLHPPLDVDGIVGPATAAALQLDLL